MPLYASRKCSCQKVRCASHVIYEKKKKTTQFTKKLWIYLHGNATFTWHWKKRRRPRELNSNSNLYYIKSLIAENDVKKTVDKKTHTISNKNEKTMTCNKCSTIEAYKKNLNGLLHGNSAFSCQSILHTGRFVET